MEIEYVEMCGPSDFFNFSFFSMLGVQRTFNATLNKNIVIGDYYFEIYNEKV